MKLSGRNKYVHDSPYFEVHINKSDTYEKVVEKAVTQLDMKGDNFVLLRASGIIIVNEPLQTSRGVTKIWTIGSYLHLCSSKLRLGVAAIHSTMQPVRQLLFLIITVESVIHL